MADLTEVANNSLNVEISAQHRRKRIFTKVAVFCGIAGAVFLVLAANMHELFGIASLPLFVGAIFLWVKTQEKKMVRSTIYVIASIITGSIGVLFLILGLYVHPVFDYGAFLLYFHAAFGVFSFVIIIASGEIFKISGIVKILLLLTIGCLIARVTVVTLEGIREKNSSACTPIKHVTSSPGNFADLTSY